MEVLKLMNNAITPAQRQRLSDFVLMADRFLRVMKFADSKSSGVNGKAVSIQCFATPVHQQTF